MVIPPKWVRSLGQEGKTSPLPAKGRLFQPGSGTPPPLLAGREHEQEKLRNALNGLVNEGCRPTTHFLFCGPRGSGKTVLLEWLQDEAAKTHGAKRKGVDVLFLEIDALDSPDSLERALAPVWRKVAGARVVRSSGGLGGKAKLPVMGEIGADAHAEVESSERFAAAHGTVARHLFDRASQDLALVLVVDEIHAAKRPGPEGTDAIRTLANALRRVCGGSAEGGRNLPVLLVAAGTADAPDRLGEAQATFLERMFKEEEGSCLYSG